MNEGLLSDPQPSIAQYDPFQNPPDLSIANTHRQATMVGSVNPKVKP